MCKLFNIILIFIIFTLAACSANQVPNQSNKVSSVDVKKKYLTPYSRKDFFIKNNYSWACNATEFADLMSATLLDGVQLIDCVIKNEDLERWYDGEEIVLDEYYIIADIIFEYDDVDNERILKQLKKKIFLDIEEVMEARKENVAGKLDELGQILSLYGDSKVTISDEGSTPLGIVINEDKIFSYATLESTGYENEGEVEIFKQVSISTVFIKESNLLIQYYYKDYYKSSDLYEAEEAVKSWVEKNILSKN